MTKLTAALTGAWPAPARPDVSARLRAARAALWRQLAYEVRRHAGDERLPPALRTRLRDAARSALERAVDTGGHRALRLPRRWIRDQPAAAMAPDLERRARAAAADAGLDLSPPFAAVSLERAFDVSELALAFLRQEGYRVVQLGAGPEIDALTLQTARLIVCDTLVVQRAAALADRPALLVGAVDVFAGYPIRDHGLYLLRRAVDLDTGREIALDERLTEAHYRNLRNCGFRRVSPDDVLDAVRELHDGIRAGWRDTDGQARWRARLTDAGAALSRRIGTVAEWGPDDGFLGDGRLARCQASEVR